MLEASRIGGSTEIEDLRLRGLYEYWDAKRADRRAPTRADINPTDIPQLLGYVNLLEVREEPRDFKVRLNGSAVAEMLGQDVTGRWCSDVTSGNDALRCKQAFDICVDQWAPALVQTSLAFCGKPYAGQTIVALPLSSDGHRVGMVITAHSYHTLDVPLHSIDFRQAQRR